MKILFVGFDIDYQQAMLLHGLRNLYGADVVDIPHVSYHYNSPTTDFSKVHGRGYGIFGLLDNDLQVDRGDVIPKLQTNYFDVCIFSLNPGIDFSEFRHLLKMARHSGNKIVFIDGNDFPKNTIEPNSGEIYFKRERCVDDGYSLPIWFAFPKEKISPLILADEKTQLFSQSQPSDLNKILPTLSNWVQTEWPINIRSIEYPFNSEKEYYQDYQQSYFGTTFKKGGWDSQRTLEIIFNSSLPYFMDIDYCPPDCMFAWPKDLLKQVKQLSIFKDVLEPVAYNVNIDKFYSSQIYKDEYNELLIKMYSYAKEHLTTEALAKYVMSRITS